MLVKNEIRSLNLIQGAVDSNFRDVSYDVRVGRIIDTQGKEVTEFTLQPQGVVEVISTELMALPSNIAGYAMVKTSLCNEGILPLNIGIVDPGWNGPLSGTLLNFGNRPFSLSPGEVFLRVTFHRCERAGTSASPRPLAEKDYQDYLRIRKKKAVGFNTTFLNVEEYVGKTTRTMLWKAVPFFAVAAIFLTLFSFLVTIGVNYSNRNAWSKEDLKGEIKQELNKQWDENRLQVLEQRLKSLETSNNENPTDKQKAGQ